MAKVESAGANKVKLTVEVTPEDFADALQKAYLKNKSKFFVQGFRKGKVPRPVIERHYGEGVFYEDAFEILFPESYTRAVKELDIVPVSRPEIDIEKISKEEGIVYTAEVYVKPEVKLGQYKGVEAELVEAEVTDEQVEAEIARIRERNARWVDVDREAQNGDKVVIDYSGSVDGVKFDGGTADNQIIELGSGTFIPGFEEQIVGMKKGEEKDLTVTFPENYRAKDLAGKEAVFHVKLHDVKQKELPDLDDDFAQDVSEFDTMDEYRADIKAKLLERAEEFAKEATQNNVLEAVVGTAEIDLPECMIENQIDQQIRQLEYSMMYQGIRLEDYLQMTGTKMEDIRAQYRESAEKSVRTQLVVEAIMKAENITATDEQVDEFIRTRAERLKKDFEEYKKTISDEELAYIRDNLAYDNTVTFLTENAKLVASKKKEEKQKAEEENSSGE
ncbi:MAG: trigger factor [Christensenellaceae bacterium]|nr:trigger factor [Christensenellaceae bacterium]